MSDEQPIHLLQAADAESPSRQLSSAQHAGALLRSAREASGYSLGAVAAIVKVPVRRLEALEAGQLDDLPEAVYVRGMVVGICRVVRADAQAILDLLPAAPAKPLKQYGAIAPMPYQMAGADSPLRVFEVVAKPHIRWALALVLGATVLYCWPTIASWTTDAALDSETLLALQPWVAKGTVAPSPSPSPSPSSASGVIGNPMVPVDSGAGQADGVTEAPAWAGEALIRLKSHGKTWVEISDAKGVTVLRRLLADGEQTEAGGQPPLSVVVGNADVTEVWVRDKVFEIKSISQSNVARFEVK